MIHGTRPSIAGGAVQHRTAHLAAGYPLFVLSKLRDAGGEPNASHISDKQNRSTRASASQMIANRPQLALC
jgi:hypothetical protein